MSEECRCEGFKLFGTQINVGSNDESVIGKRSYSLGSLDLGSLDTCNTESVSEPKRKRGNPWSEEEHKSFLIGLEKLGRGDWKGISKNFVLSRNSSQVASHAQKYFKRMSAREKKRRRTSVFDISIKDETSSVSQEFPSSSLINKYDESSQEPKDSSFSQRQGTATIQTSVFVPHIHMNVANGTTFGPQPSVVRLRHEKSSSPPPSAITPTNSR